MGLQGMKMAPNSGNRYLLVVEDRGTVVFAASPHPSKKSIGISRKLLLEVLVVFGLTLSIRCDPGGEFIAGVMKHLCRWLKVSLGYRPKRTTGERSREQWKGSRGGCRRCSLRFVCLGLSDWISMCLSSHGFITWRRTQTFQDGHHRTGCCSIETPVPSWMSGTRSG